MIQPAFEILNQRGTPMFFSDIYANIPTAGIVGRIFISTDTKEFYRDTGTTWELIGGPGAGTITGSGTTGRLSKFTSSSSIGDSIVTEGTSLINITGSNSRFVVGGTDDGSSQLQTYYDGNTRWKFVSASNNADDDADITGYKSRGTIATPLAIQSGDAITNYSGRGYNGTAFVGGGGFDVFAAENYSVGANGTYIAIETTPIGSATNTYFHRFSANGGFHVGQNSDPATGYTFQTTGNSFISGRLEVNNTTADNQLRVSGSSSPSIRLDNALTAPTQRFAIGLSTATNNFIQGSTAGDICITTASASPVLFGMWQTINASEVMRISTANNLILGKITDSGERLQVNGRLLITGSSVNSTFDSGSNNDARLEFKRNGTRLSLLNWDTGVTGFQMDSNNTFYITGGNVGINTTAPQERLQVNGTSVGIAIDGTTASRTFYNRSGSYIWSTGLRAGDTNYYIYDERIGARLIINDSGNLGLGVTPSAWASARKAIELGKVGASLSSGANATEISLSANAYDATGGWTYAVTGATTLYQQNSGSHVWYNAPSGTAGNAISFTEAMRLTSTGNLLIGTTTDGGQKLQVNGDTSSFGSVSSTDGTAIARIQVTGNAGRVVLTDTRVGGIRYDLGCVRVGAGIFSINDSTSSGAPARFCIFPSGNTFIGFGTVDNGSKFTIDGSLRLNGQTSGTAGGNSGQHLIINCDGTTYKIALLNP